MDIRHTAHSLTPAKAGRIYGTLIPSLPGIIRLKDENGKVKIARMNRRDRRALLK